MASALEPVFPNITRWVKDFGIVEIGYDPNTDSFIRAIDDGGGVWTGKPRYETLDDALMDLEAGIKAALKSRRTRKKPAPAAAKTAKKPDHRKTKPSEAGSAQAGPEARRDHRGDTPAKSEWRSPGSRSSRSSARTTRRRRLSPCSSPGKPRCGCVRRRASGDTCRLANRAIRGMKSAPDQLAENYDGPLLGLLREIEKEQNRVQVHQVGRGQEHQVLGLADRREGMRAFIRTYEAPYWLYQATRDYVGGSVFLEKRQIPQIEEIARFWRRYFKGKARG